jgi:hypothetical protein
LAAALVLRHGEQLLPVFRRLDDECAALDRQSDALMRVRAIAGREPAGATG